MGYCLVIDDDETSREILAGMISACGHRVIQAHNAKVALKRCQHRPPDFIFVDWMMPKTDGVEFIRELDAMIQGDKRPKIIMCTARSQSDAPSHTLGVDIDGYLQKPIDIPDIRNILD